MAIKLEVNGTQKKLVLSGLLDENFNVVHALGTQASELTGNIAVDCAAITRINSTGIKHWILFFNGLRTQGVKFNFHRVSPVIVEQLNLISNFSAGGEVVSVCLPYTCKDCGANLTFVQDHQQIKGIDLDSVSWVCTKCGNKHLEFDDIGEEYLHFWK
jgi:ABC-type transporter Mla MlaB component